MSREDINFKELSDSYRCMIAACLVAKVINIKDGRVIFCTWRLGDNWKGKLFDIYHLSVEEFHKFYEPPRFYDAIEGGKLVKKRFTYKQKVCL